MADIAFVPQSAHDTEHPPFIVELKAGIGAEEAVAQIRSRNYLSIFKDALIDESHFAATPLAVGIAWDPDTKAHECIVEEVTI